MVQVMEKPKFLSLYKISQESLNEITVYNYIIYSTVDLKAQLQNPFLYS